MSTTFSVAPSQRRPREILPWGLVSPNLFWLLVFLACPLVVLLILSFRTFVPGVGISDDWSLGNYARFLADDYNLSVLIQTLFIGLEVAAAALVLGLPVALVLSRAGGKARAILYFLVLVPVLTSAVVRTFGWMILLSNNGAVNRLLSAIGLTDAPLRIMYSQIGVVIALTEVLLPFMVLSLDASLLNLQPALAEAARSMGARPARVFLSITLPLIAPGMISGSVLVFSLAISSFVTPALIGGQRVKVMPTLIYQTTIAKLDWPLGAAAAFVMLAAIVIVVVLSLFVFERRRSMAR